MIFSTKAEYGVRLMVELGRRAGDGPTPLNVIAEREHLPLAYLERIVALLKRAGLVQSTRGAHGGYVLALKPEDIKMDQVVLALEGSLAPMECFVDDRADDGRVLCSHHDDSGRGCATKLLWTRVQVGVSNTLAQTSLAELIEFQSRQLSRVSGERPAPDERTPTHA